MSRKSIFTKSELIEKSFEIFKSQGLDYLTARNLSKELNCSPAPIYNLFSSMETLKLELIKKAENIFMEYVVYPETNSIFLNNGVGLCVFAREEKELFKSIFLKKNSFINLIDRFKSLVYNEMERDVRFYSLTSNTKDEIFIDSWIIAYGLAVLIATDYFENPTTKFITDRLLSSAGILIDTKLKKEL